MSESKEHKSKKETTKVGAVIVLIISAIVFLPAGGVAVYQGLFNKDKTPVFGSYNGKKIKYEMNSKFVNAASNIKNEYQRRGFELTQQDNYTIFNQAFNQTVLNLAFDELINKSGYTVPASAVNRILVTLPVFMDENGKFSQKIFNTTETGIIDEYREEINDSLRFTRVVDDFFGSETARFRDSKLYGLKYSSKESEFINSMGNEKHEFTLAAFNTEDYPATEAAKYGKENAELFTKYDISAVTLETEKEAKSVLKQIKSGSLTFEEAVETKSEKYYTGTDGKLASPYRYQLSDMLADEEKIPELLSVGQDEISNPIETKMGYTIFRKDSDPVAADFSSEEIINVVLSYLKSNEMGHIEEYYTSIAKDFATEAAVTSFTTACKRFDVEQVTTESFPINYGNSNLYQQSTSVSELASITNNADLLQKVFALKENEISEPLLIDSKILVVKCTAINKEEGSKDSLTQELVNTDQGTLQQTILTGDKVENNFLSTYIKYFINNEY